MAELVVHRLASLKDCGLNLSKDNPLWPEKLFLELLSNDDLVDPEPKI
jgi:hypothetical protein